LANQKDADLLPKNQHRKLGQPVSKLVLFNAKAVSAILAGVIAIFSALFLYMAVKVALTVIISTVLLTFITSFLLIFLATEFLIFREINKIYAILEKLRTKKDIKVVSRQLRKHGKNAIPGSPFTWLNNELLRFASRK
jgi:two-component system phosphate regulon sensor histidine kinase PhoR